MDALSGSGYILQWRIKCWKQSTRKDRTRADFPLPFGIPGPAVQLFRTSIAFMAIKSMALTKPKYSDKCTKVEPWTCSSLQLRQYNRWPYTKTKYATTCTGVAFPSSVSISRTCGSSRTALEVPVYGLKNRWSEKGIARNKSTRIDFPLSVSNSQPCGAILSDTWCFGRLRFMAIEIDGHKKKQDSGG